jgi:hypothetical protein
MALSSGDNPVAGTLTATTTPAALGSQTCISVLVQADPGNSNNLLIGDANSQPINLLAGQGVTIACSNINKVYVAGNGGNATANWLVIQ